jgi:hypothetical protein
MIPVGSRRSEASVNVERVVGIVSVVGEVTAPPH